MPIPDIRLNDIRIGEVNIQTYPSWITEPPNALPIYPPVTSEVGTPIVDIPGCVEVHKDNRENQNLKEEDPEGTVTLCDAGTPSAGYGRQAQSWALLPSAAPWLWARCSQSQQSPMLSSTRKLLG